MIAIVSTEMVSCIASKMTPNSNKQNNKTYAVRNTVVNLALIMAISRSSLSPIKIKKTINHFIFEFVHMLTHPYLLSYVSNITDIVKYVKYK